MKYELYRMNTFIVCMYAYGYAVWYNYNAYKDKTCWMSTQFSCKSTLLILLHVGAEICHNYHIFDMYAA